jgi:hypothetical protein
MGTETKEGRCPNALAPLEKAKLLLAVSSTYSGSGLIDRTFAEKFQADTGIATLHHHVCSARKQLGISANAVTSNARIPLLPRIAELEAKLAQAMDRIDVLERFEFIQYKPKNT